MTGPSKRGGDVETIVPTRANSPRRTLSSPKVEKDDSDLSAYGRTDPEAPSPASTDDLPPRISLPRVALLCTAMLMTYFLGTACYTSVTLLVPDIARDLGCTELEAQWVASSYGLAYGCGLLFSGRLADIYGRKFLYLGGLSTFCIFSILSGVIKVRVALCVIRALAGLGLAVAAPAGFGIITSTVVYEPERTITIAAFGLGNPIGASVGTILGGAVAGVGRGGWEYLFYILAGATLIPFTIGIFVVPRDHRGAIGQAKDRRIDIVGGLMVTTGVCLFTFSLTQSGIAPKGWIEPYIPALLAVSIVLLIVFFFWSRHLELHTTFPPIIKTSLFTRHHYKVTATCLASFFACFSIYGWVYVTTIFYQSYKGLSALDNAIRMLTANIVGLLAAGAVMFLAPRFDAGLLIAIGGLLGGVLYAITPGDTTYWSYEFAGQVLLPFGIDFPNGVGNILIANMIERNEQSVGGALFQTMAQVGGALGICMTSLLSTQRARSTGDLLTGLRDAFWMETASSFLVIVVVAVGLRRVGLAKDVGRKNL